MQKINKIKEKTLFYKNPACYILRKIASKYLTMN